MTWSICWCNIIITLCNPCCWGSTPWHRTRGRSLASWRACCKCRFCCRTRKPGGTCWDTSPTPPPWNGHRDCADKQLPMIRNTTVTEVKTYGFRNLRPWQANKMFPLLSTLSMLPWTLSHHNPRTCNTTTDNLEWKIRRNLRYRKTFVVLTLLQLRGVSYLN